MGEIKERVWVGAKELDTWHVMMEEEGMETEEPETIRNWERAGV